MSPKIICFTSFFQHTLRDNTKYLYGYLSALKEDYSCFFLTENTEFANYLKKKGVQAYSTKENNDYVSALQEADLIITNELAYIDRETSIFNDKKILQLWKFLPIRKMGLAYELEKNKPHFKGYHSIVCSSEWTQKNIMQACFEGQQFPITGYPKTDVLYRELTEFDKIGTSTSLFEKCQSLIREGQNVYFYIPEERDPPNRVPIAVAELIACHSVLKAYNAHVIVPYLPSYFSKIGIPIQDLTHIHFESHTNDYYPLFRLFSGFITDYHPMYLDYLHTGKPILFFPFDYGVFAQLDRGTFVDYTEMTPGLTVYNPKQLPQFLELFFTQSYKEYAPQRHALRSQFFDHTDGENCKRIEAYIRTII
jgi:CDP-glycerol glycerophosphotransferase (TagB/SpsB family)